MTPHARALPQPSRPDDIVKKAPRGEEREARGEEHEDVEVEHEDVYVRHELVHALADFVDGVGHWDELLQCCGMLGKPQVANHARQTTLRRHGQSSAQAEQCTRGRAQQRTLLIFTANFKAN
jgi:hypothetical protein